MWETKSCSLSPFVVNKETNKAGGGLPNLPFHFPNLLCSVLIFFVYLCWNSVSWSLKESSFVRLCITINNWTQGFWCPCIGIIISTHLFGHILCHLYTFSIPTSRLLNTAPSHFYLFCSLSRHLQASLNMSPLLTSNPLPFLRKEKVRVRIKGLPEKLPLLCFGTINMHFALSGSCCGVF